MGILDLLRFKKLPPGDPQTQKAGLKLISKNVDGPTRYAAADTLTEIGSKEAIYCLLQRFTVVIGTDIPDEDEKKYVNEKILAFGDRAVEPIMKFLRDKEVVGQALKILRQISSPEDFLDLLLELAASYDPYFSKYPDKKLQTFKELKQYKDPRIIEVLEVFLEDDDDDVRIAVIEALAAQEDEEKTRELFIRTILEAEECPRIRIAACEAIARLRWKVRGFRKQIASVIPDQFYLDAKSHINIKRNA